VGSLLDVKPTSSRIDSPSSKQQGAAHACLDERETEPFSAVNGLGRCLWETSSVTYPSRLRQSLPHSHRDSGYLGSRDGTPLRAHYVGLTSSVVAIVAIAAALSTADGQEPGLAPEGRGLLPMPTEMPAALGGPRPEHPLVSDPSGAFSRTVFETDEDPNFRLAVRDLSFPPHRQAHTVTLPFAAFVQILGGQAEIKIADTPLLFNGVARAAVVGRKNCDG